MNENISPAKSGIQLGILFGIIMVLEFVVTYTIGIESLMETKFGMVINFLNYLILPCLFIYMGCNNYKKNLNHGYISFSQCLKLGVSISFIAALIYGLFNILFYKIFPDFADQVLNATRSQMLKQNPSMTSEQLEMSLKMVKKMMNPYLLLPIMLVMYSFIGLLYSLIIGAIIKKEKPESF